MVMGVDSLGRGRTRPPFDLSVTRDSYLSAAAVFKLVILNICLQFLYFAYGLWYLLVLSPVPILLMFVTISLKNCANILYIIVDLCWLSICWWTSCCKFDDWHHHIYDMPVYCMILISFWICFGYFQDCLYSSLIDRLDFRMKLRVD